MRFSKNSSGAPKGNHMENLRGVEVRRCGGSEFESANLLTNMQSLLQKDSLMIPKEFPRASGHSRKIPI
eukprot:1962717-Karenia_brevis.AAC.1